MRMLPQDVENWLIDFLTCFSIVLFIFMLKILLCLSVTKNKFSKEEISMQFESLVNDGQAALLVVAYDIMTIRNLFHLKYIRYIRNLYIVLLVIIIIYNIVLYVLVKEVEYFKDEKMVNSISLGFLAFSVLTSLSYTVAQLFA